MFSKTKDGKVYSCTHCDYTNTTLFSFTDHMLTHSKVYPLGCSQCTKRFATNTHLIQHVQHYHTAASKVVVKNNQSPPPALGGELVCPECGFTTKRCDTLSFHATQHIGMYKYTCTICFLNFHRSDHLSRHIAEQHKAFPLTVEDCENKSWRSAVNHLYQNIPKYVTYNQLTAMKLPNAEGSQCSLCQSIFTSSVSLNHHIRTIHCASSSKQKQKADVITKPDGCKAWCGQCKQAFNNRIALYWHNKKVHNKLTTKGKFQCTLCNTYVTVRANLKRHMINVHGRESTLLTPNIKKEQSANLEAQPKSSQNANDEESQELRIDQVYYAKDLVDLPPDC